MSNDTCASPTPIGVGQMLSGDTSNAVNDYAFGTTRCTGFHENGPDVVYSFTPPASGTYTITVTPTSSTYDPAVYLLDTCPASGSSISSCVGGADTGWSGQPETLSLPLTAGVQYFIVVDGFSSGGPFTLSIASGGGGAASGGGAVLDSCSTSADCACPMDCVNDPGFGGSRCEERCTTTADCANLLEACANGHCSDNFCNTNLAFQPAPGTYNQPCDAMDAGDGYCIQQASYGGGHQFAGDYGVCVQGGSARAACDSTATRSSLSSACAAGTFCFGPTGGGTLSQCSAFCDPTASTNSCPSGTACQAGQPNAPQYGVCR